MLCEMQGGCMTSRANPHLGQRVPTPEKKKKRTAIVYRFCWFSLETTILLICFVSVNLFFLVVDHLDFIFVVPAIQKTKSDLAEN